MHGKRFSCQNERRSASQRWRGGRPSGNSSRAWLTRARALVPTSEEERVRDLNHDFKELCRHNRDGSYATQADREHILDVVANQLHEMGHRGLRAQGLKPKHVEKLTAHWLVEELSLGTIKNRMSALRWAAQKLGKDNIVARTNAGYGIPDRVYVTTSPKQSSLA